MQEGEGEKFGIVVKWGEEKVGDKRAEITTRFK